MSKNLLFWLVVAFAAWFAYVHFVRKVPVKR